MRRPISLTLRLNLFFGFSALIVFSSFGWFIERSIEQHFNSGDAAELDVIAIAASNAIIANQHTNDKILKQRLSDFLVGHHRAILQVTLADNSLFYKSNTIPDLSQFSFDTTHDNTTIKNLTSGKHNYRILTRKFTKNESNHFAIAVAMPIDFHLSFLYNFRYALWSMIASGIAVMGIMGWIAIRQGHVPLHNIISQIRQIHVNDLNTRLDPDSVPYELRHLAISFNEMLARMEQDFQRISNFSADIAHELRTPVTSLLTQTQVALAQSRSNEEYQEILYSNIEEYEHMAQMISDMLFLAQTENGLYELVSVDIDLSKEVNKLFEYYEAWAEDNGISLSLSGNASVMGDRLMLRRVIGNLLSNAIKHTAKGQQVNIDLSQLNNREVIICVENPGVNISEEHILHLFDRFYRVDASRQRNTDSTGLGLAIAKSIVEIHNGTINVKSADGITRFYVTLPTVL